MMESQNNIIVLISVGFHYNNLLIKDFYYLKNKVKVVVFTDEVGKVQSKLGNKAEVLEYKSKVFKYFDKFFLSYYISKREKQPVAYLDIKRLKYVRKYNLLNFDKTKIDCLYSNGSWEGIPNASFLYSLDSAYFEKGYWNNILEFIENKGVDINKVVPLLERCFVIPYNTNFGKVIETLKEVQPLFEENSILKKNVYSGIGNGEGLALAYSILVNNYNNKTVDRLPSKSKLV